MRTKEIIDKIVGAAYRMAYLLRRAYPREYLYSVYPYEEHCKVYKLIRILRLIGTTHGSGIITGYYLLKTSSYVRRHADADMSRLIEKFTH